MRGNQLCLKQKIDLRPLSTAVAKVSQLHHLHGWATKAIVVKEMQESSRVRATDATGRDGTSHGTQTSSFEKGLETGCFDFAKLRLCHRLTSVLLDLSRCFQACLFRKCSKTRREPFPLTQLHRPLKQQILRRSPRHDRHRSPGPRSRSTGGGSPGWNSITKKRMRPGDCFAVRSSGG